MDYLTKREIAALQERAADWHRAEPGADDEYRRSYYQLQRAAAGRLARRLYAEAVASPGKVLTSYAGRYYFAEPRR